VRAVLQAFCPSIAKRIQQIMRGASARAGRQAVFNWVHTARGLLDLQPDDIEHDFNVLGMSRDLEDTVQEHHHHHGAVPG
jgi:hypothetical protein